MSATRRPMLLAWSGGKDAAWTLHRLRQQAGVDVVGLLTTVDAITGHVAVHHIRRELLHAQAALAGLPLIEAPLPAGCDNARYETAMAAALAQARMRWPALDTIAFGDLFLGDVRAWREATLARLGWHVETPLFGLDTAALAHEMIAGGLHARLCCVDTQLLDPAFCGRDFDDRLLAELPASCDPCGENGEFHTLVTAGPMFNATLHVRDGAATLHQGRFQCLDLVPA